MKFLTRRTALKAAAVAIPTPALAQPRLPAARRPDQPLFGAITWTLANGLRVVLAESRRTPVAGQHLYVSAGAGEDPAGKSGVAHFLEHMMFKGSTHIPSGAFSRTVAREGGHDNAFTSQDVTAYFQTVEASRLPLMMRMEADRLAAPLIPEAETESERNVVLEERRQTTDAVPRGRFHEAVGAAMWGSQHWRGRPVIGWENEIRAITRQDMVDFHTAHYAPSNCTLIVAGNIREADLRRWAEEFYGPIPARPKLARRRAEPLATAPQPRLIMRDAAVREPSFVQAFSAPSATWGDTTKIDPLDVMVDILGGGRGSRLHRALVEPGHAISASASYDGDVVGVGSLVVAVRPRPGVSQARIEEIVTATIVELVQDGATAAETRRSIRQQTAGALLALDGLGAAPRMLGAALAIGLPIEAVEHWPARMAAVTDAQVNASARMVFGNPAVTTAAWLLPQ